MRVSSGVARSRGFSLIELLVAITIMGVLAAVIVPGLLDRLDDSKVARARSDIATLVQQLKLYKMDNGRYPTAEQGLDALVRKPSSGPIPSNWHPYLDKQLPTDPWNSPYQYVSPGVKGEVDVFSFGRDQKAGGEGVDADIGSWQ